MEPRSTGQPRQYLDYIAGLSDLVQANLRFIRAAYQRGIMDACSDPALETVIFMSSSQVGKALDGAMSATVRNT